MNIRPAIISDVPSIMVIYNEAVLNTVATFDTVPRTLEQQKEWFSQHSPSYPVLVAEEKGHVIGWASQNRYSDRLAYARTAELSLYVRVGYRGQGVGRKLMEAILEAGKAGGLHTVLSRIVEGNDSSIHLHKQFGFDTIGTMREVGFKFDCLLDVILMQKML
jgi:L-amino acid N-acyltransferase